MKQIAVTLNEAMLSMLSNTSILLTSGCLLLSGNFMATAQIPVVQKTAKKPLKIIDLGTGGVAPNVGYVKGINKDGRHLEFVEIAYAASFEKRVFETEEEVQEGGKTVMKPVKAERTVMVQTGENFPSTYQIPLDQLRVYDTEGRRIPAAKIPALFASPRIVAYQYEGLKVDPMFLNVMRVETPFVVVPNRELNAKELKELPDLGAPR